MSITRRVFLRNGALAVVGTAAIPAFLTRAAYAARIAERAKQAPGRHLPARRSRRPQHRRAARRAGLLRHASVHQHSAQRGDRSRRILRTASFAVALPAAVEAAPSGHRARRRLARPHPLALRCAGLHGIRHAGREGHRRRLAEPGPAFFASGRFGRQIRLSRHRPGAFPAANSFRQRARSRPEQHQRLRCRRKQSQSHAHRQHLRSHVRALGRFRAARHRTGNFRSSKDAEGPPIPRNTSPQPAPTIPTDASATASSSSLNSSKPTWECKSRSPTSAAGTITSTKAAPRARSPTSCASSRNPSPHSGPTSAISPKIRSSSPCPSSAAPPAKTATAAPTTATPT